MSAPGDLVTLAAVKAWLGQSTTASDAILAPLISAVSRAIYGAISRPVIAAMNFNEVRDGGGRRIVLRNWPVLSIQSVIVGGLVIPAAAVPTVANPNPSSTGWLLDPWDGTPPGSPQKLDIVGFCVPRGPQSVRIAYSAGYAVQGEAWTAQSSITPLQPYGAWLSDIGVTYAATGAALVKVAANPAQGQYSVSSLGTYSFASADAGAAVLLSYSFVPADLAQAALELINEHFASKDRPGVVSKTLGGQETVSFSQKPMSSAIQMLLQPYMRVIPL